MYVCMYVCMDTQPHVKIIALSYSNIINFGVNH